MRQSGDCKIVFKFLLLSDRYQNTIKKQMNEWTPPQCFRYDAYVWIESGFISTLCWLIHCTLSSFHTEIMTGQSASFSFLLVYFYLLRRVQQVSMSRSNSAIITVDSLFCVSGCRCLRCYLVALKVPARPQRLLWEMPPHRQPEAVALQELPKCLRGHEAGPQPEAEPHHPVRPEQRQCLLQRPRQTGDQTSLLQPAERLQAASPVWRPGASVRALLGHGQSDTAARLHHGDVGVPHSGGAGAFAGVTVWSLVEWRQERSTQPEPVVRRTASAQTPGTQQRWMWAQVHLFYRKLYELKFSQCVREASVEGWFSFDESTSTGMNCCTLALFSLVWKTSEHVFVKSKQTKRWHRNTRHILTFSLGLSFILVFVRISPEKS